jgi:hypothetical protein
MQVRLVNSYKILIRKLDVIVFILFKELKIKLSN